MRLGYACQHIFGGRMSHVHKHDYRTKGGENSLALLHYIGESGNRGAPQVLSHVPRGLEKRPTQDRLQCHSRSESLHNAIIIDNAHVNQSCDNSAKSKELHHKDIVQIPEAMGDRDPSTSASLPERRQSGD
jgi:hypothetical protein